MRTLPGIAWNGVPLLAPLTGVGHYTAHLLRELPAAMPADMAAQLHVFLARHWALAGAVLGTLSDSADSDSSSPGSGLARLKISRGLLGWMPWLRGVIRDRQSRLFQHGCRDRSAVLYHEPNFIAYPFDGPIVLTVHDLSFLRHPETQPAERVRFMTRSLPDSLARASTVLVVSDFVRQELINEFGAAIDHKIKVVLNGVSNSFFPRSPQDPRMQQVLRRYQLAHKSYLMAVGTLEPRKNLITLIRAYVSLPQQIKSRFPLVIVGPSGWRTSLFEKELARYRHESIRLLGYVDQQELPVLYSGARLSIYPSIYEGFGLPVLEAMASGTPVIASNTSSIPQVLADAGLLQDPLDVQGFARAIMQVIEDAVIAHQKTQRGLARAAELSWSRAAAQVWDVYRPLLAGGLP